MPVSQQDRAVEAGRDLWKSPNPPAQSRSTLLRSVSSWALSICKNGYPTTSLGNLCQGSTIFTVRKVFPALQTDFSVFQYVPIASCPVLGLLKRVWLCLLSPNSLTRNLYTWIRSYSAFPSSDWTVPAAFVSSPVQSVYTSHSFQFSISADLVRVQQVSSSWSLMKLLNSVRPSINPWGTQLMTELQLGWSLLITALWSQQFSHFSIYLAVHLSSLYFKGLSVRMFWEMALKSKGPTSTHWSPLCPFSHSFHQKRLSGLSGTAGCL